MAAEDTERGARTRQLIVDTALDLFREHGYDRTTMRGIADAAGLSPGNAYYYFPSKQHLVQGFYAQIQDEHRRRAADALTRRRNLTGRLTGALHAGLDVMAPYHRFAGSFIKVAIEPGSPLSPFSPESAPSRETGIALFREVVEGCTDAMDPRLREDLPELLWLAYLGVTVFWVHDRSAGQARTRTLVDGAAPLLGRLVRMSRLPGVRSVVGDALRLLHRVRP
jgi:AcrR family transcriptional regulator